MQCIPVRRGGRLIGLLTRESSATFARRTGELERTYLETFQRFAQMIADGSFPFDLDEIEIESAPRVGDGVILIDGEMRVKFASPNAVSLLHRLGIHTYAQHAYLADIGFDDDAARDAMRRHLPVATEIERDDVSMFLRVLPLFEDDEPTGALLLMRDVSDLRRRDRMLLSKDATIREIHHRVKNNLQTIAALLRLQARRLHSPEARAALVESERRIRSIAIVHETLSRDAGDVIRFNEIVRPLARLVEDTSSSPDLRIRFVVDGDAGELPGEVATPLAVVLNELMQNAVDHAFAEGVGGQGRRAARPRRRSRDDGGARHGRRAARPVLVGGVARARPDDRAGARDRRARWLDRDAQRRRNVGARHGAGGGTESRAVASRPGLRRPRNPCAGAGALPRSGRPTRRTPGWCRARTRGTPW